MNKLEQLFYDNGFATQSDLSDLAIEELTDRANETDLSIPENRKDLIEDFSLEVEHFHLDKIENHFPKNNMEESIFDKLEYLIQFVEISYVANKNGFEYYFEENNFKVNYPYNKDFYNENSILKIVSSHWELSSMFMNEDQKKESAKRLLEEKVKTITEQTNFLDELYKKLPEILAEEELF